MSNEPPKKLTVAGKVYAFCAAVQLLIFICILPIAFHGESKDLPLCALVAVASVVGMWFALAKLQKSMKGDSK